MIDISGRRALSALPAFAALSALAVAACAPAAAPGRLASAEVPASAEAEDADFVTASGKPLSVRQIDAFVERQMRDLDMPGLTVAVFDDGEIVYEDARGLANTATGRPVEDGSVFEAASMSKTVFAYMVMRLADRGIIDLDRPLHEYLPMEELAHDPRYREITARMALSHRTGFPNWRWFDPAPESWGIQRGTMYMKADPGTYTYSGEGYAYLSEVVAKLTDTDMTTLDGVFQREVAEPLGMTQSSFIRTDYVAEHKVTGHFGREPSDEVWPRSYPDDTPLTFGAAGRLHTNAPEFARFLIALMEGEGLSPEAHRDMFAKHTQVPLDSENHRITGETGWGLGIAIEPTPYGTRYEHGGNNGEFQSGYIIFPQRRMGFVFMTNSDRGQEFNAAIEQFLTTGAEALPSSAVASQPDR
ncbi:MULTISPECIES: serine hydrolase domain-containing protein [Pacificimonas]|nr:MULTISPECIES: serine hydrolase domain-containing protein [Pacificimonas]MBZ6377532.1 beta-lactamase family protein [Pacificimonas aurantium]